MIYLDNAATSFPEAPGVSAAVAAALGTLESGGTLRLSPGYLTSDSEIDEALEAMEEILG